LPGTSDTFTTVAFTGDSASQSGLFTFANGLLSAVVESPALLQSLPPAAACQCS
jgi:hypothetical protein